jgi:hypothetical protein
MRKFFLFLFIFCTFVSPIFADKYFRDGDIMENKYFDTLGYTIGELIESEQCPNCIEYDIEDIKGSTSSEVLGVVHIDDITDLDPRYGLMRLHGLYDEVSLPPYSKVDFIYWSKNTSDTDVNISSLKMFLSRMYSYQGDITKIVDIQGEYESLPIKYIIWEYPRNGLVKTYPGIGMIGRDEGVFYGMRLDSAYVKSPLIFQRWEAKYEGEELILSVYVVNQSEEVLPNVKYTHQGYTETRQFEENEEYVYRYPAQVDEQGNMGYVEIYNPNTKKECIARGENIESNFVGDSPVVGGIREENGGYMAYIGSRVKPFGYTFCITQIPYAMYSQEIILNPPVQEDETEEEEIVEETVQEETPAVEETEEEVVKEETPVVEETEEEVLGVTQLPKTGKYNNSFLVVFLILWYYLLRRILYEIKIQNTRIHSKDSEDTV